MKYVFLELDYLNCFRYFFNNNSIITRFFLPLFRSIIFLIRFDSFLIFVLREQINKDPSTEWDFSLITVHSSRFTVHGSRFTVHCPSQYQSFIRVVYNLLTVKTSKGIIGEVLALTYTEC